jgi:hypothetical protein
LALLGAAAAVVVTTAVVYWFIRKPDRPDGTEAGEPQDPGDGD